MKRLLLALAVGTILAGCGTPEAPARPAAVPADSASLLARPTLTPAPAAPTTTPFPTEPPTSAALPTSAAPTAAESIPPTAEPTATEIVPPTATEIVPPTAAPRQVAGVDPDTWSTYQNDQYGFSLRYPPCLGEVFEEPPFDRSAGLYTEGHNRMTSRVITTTLNLGSGPVSPDCVAQAMRIWVWELEGYSNYNLFADLTYDPASDTWFSNRGDGAQPDSSELVAGEGWQGHSIGFGDAEILISGLAIPNEGRNLMLEISFGYRFSQDGPPAQGLDAKTIDQILQTVRFTP